MTKVVGVRFRQVGKIYFFAPGKYSVETGQHVIVETARGVEYGQVVLGEREVEEGCLSFPNQFAKVVRPDEVTAEYTDRNGKRVKVKAKDLLAQAICHEYDHLEGEVFVDKIVPGTMEYVEPEK